MRIFFVIAFGFLFLGLSAQDSDVESLISNGIELHENGKFEEAEKVFRLVLKKEKSSVQARFELAYTLMQLGRYEEAVCHSKEVVLARGEHLLEAYLVYGSSLELIGKIKRAVKVYHTALKSFPGNYLLNYNLALTFYNQNRFDEAQEYAVRAIEGYSAHANSHLLLGYIMFRKGERIRAMLPLYYFLVLEQDSDRSEEAFDLLSDLWGEVGHKVAKRLKKMSIYGADASGFGVVELAIEQFEDGYQVMNCDEGDFLNLFVADTELLFAKISNEKKANQGFFWDFYGAFFSEVISQELGEPLGYFISHCKFKPEVLAWLSDNHHKFNELIDWMESR